MLSPQSWETNPKIQSHKSINASNITDKAKQQNKTYFI